MTPVADDTALGAVQAAIDGETMMPLQLEVFAKSGGAAVLRFGFDSVSYDPVDAALFEFTPPGGAKVTTKQIDPSKMQDQAGAKTGHSADGGQKPTEAEKAAREKLARRALLTLDQAQGLVDYQIGLGARLRRAAVPLGLRVRRTACPLTALGSPLFKMGLGGGRGGSPTDAGATGPHRCCSTATASAPSRWRRPRRRRSSTKQLKQLPALVGDDDRRTAPRCAP